MHSIDFDALFATVVHEVAGEALARHGIDVITEEQLEWMMRGIRNTVHLPALGEMRRELGLSTLTSQRMC
jgi:hypothetical protein